MGVLIYGNVFNFIYMFVCYDMTGTHKRVDFFCFTFTMSISKLIVPSISPKDIYKSICNFSGGASYCKVGVKGIGGSGAPRKISKTMPFRS